MILTVHLRSSRLSRIQVAILTRDALYEAYKYMGVEITDLSLKLEPEDPHTQSTDEGF